MEEGKEAYSKRQTAQYKKQPASTSKSGAKSKYTALR